MAGVQSVCAKIKHRRGNTMGENLMDEVDNATFVYIQTLTGNADVDWSISGLREIASIVAKALERKGIPVYIPDSNLCAM